MRRTTKVGAAAASLALLLAACSSGDDTATTDTPSSSAPAAGSGTFTIWADEVRSVPLKAECDKFAEANGITCEVVQIDFGDIRAKVVQGNQTGDVPDLFVGAHDWLGELVTNGVVTPFDLGAKSADFSEVAVKAVAYDGKSYGVPYAVENVALLTNPALSPECPASLDDLISQGEALLKDKKASLPLALQIGDKGDAYHWYPLYSANGGYIFGENADGTTNVEDMGVGQAGSITAAESLQEMADKKLIKASVTGDIAKESYGKGDSAWFITGPWNVPDALKAVPDTDGLPRAERPGDLVGVHRRADDVHPDEGEERPHRADVPQRLRDDHTSSWTPCTQPTRARRRGPSPRTRSQPTRSSRASSTTASRASPSRPCPRWVRSGSPWAWPSSRSRRVRIRPRPWRQQAIPSTRRSPQPTADRLITT